MRECIRLIPNPTGQGVSPDLILFSMRECMYLFDAQSDWTGHHRYGVSPELVFDRGF